MKFNFLPQNFNFFVLFERQVGYAVDAAVCFRKVAEQGLADEESLERMKEIEHQGDEAAHAIFDQLNKTFITPFDREDIHALAIELDDVTDMLNTIINRLKVYKLTGVNANLVKFAGIIEESVRAMQCAVHGMRDSKNRAAVATSCVEINRLENVGDDLRDQMLSELFEREKDPITLIKWKEIYQDAETILDICEDVAHVVDSILVKQA